jgi:hypothetical protein
MKLLESDCNALLNGIPFISLEKANKILAERTQSEMMPALTSRKRKSNAKSKKLRKRTK